MTLLTLLFSIAAQAKPMDFAQATAAFNSAPAPTVTTLAREWTMIAMTSQDMSVGTDPNGNYKNDDGTIVRQTIAIDSHLQATYATLNVGTGQVLQSFVLNGVLKNGSLVLDIPNSSCHQVDSCRVIKAGRLLCASSFVDPSEACNDVGGKGPQYFTDLKP